MIEDIRDWKCVGKYTPEGTTAALLRSWADELTVIGIRPLAKEMREIAAELEEELASTELGTKLYFEYRAVFSYPNDRDSYGPWVTTKEAALRQEPYRAMETWGRRSGLQWREIGPTHTWTEENHP